MMPDKLVIPRLEVKKDWYVSLLPDPMDRSHPDVHNDLLVQEALMNSMARKLSSAICLYVRVVIRFCYSILSYCVCHLSHLIV